jgi:hypothetical protein
MTEKAYFAKLAKELGEFRINSTCRARRAQIQRHVYHMYKEAGYDLKRAQEFTEKCLNLAVKPDSEEIRKFLARASKKMWYNLLNSLDVIELLENPNKFSPKQKSILSLYLYLNLVEGAITEYIEFITFLLLKNGHDIYDPRRMQFAKSYEDIQNIDMYIKEQFLDLHGFDFVTSALDRELRNCIAHQDFVIFEDGNIKNLKNQELIDIEKKVGDLQLTCTLISVTIQHVLDVIFPETDKNLSGGN